MLSMSLQKEHLYVISYNNNIKATEETGKGQQHKSALGAHTEACTLVAGQEGDLAITLYSLFSTPLSQSTLPPETHLMVKSLKSCNILNALQ